MDNTQAFTLTAGRGTFASNADGTILVKADAKNAKDTKQQFAFVKKNNESTTYYIYNISAGKFVGGDVQSNVPLSNIGAEFELTLISGQTGDKETYNGKWMIKKANESNWLMFNGSFISQITNYSSPDDGDAFEIADAVAATEAIQNAVALLNTVDVTYNVTFNGSVVASASGKAVIGQTPELPASLNNGLYNYTNTTGGDVTNATTEITFNATWNGPFDLSTNYNNAKWYNLKIRGTKYVGKTATEPYNNIENVSNATRVTDAYQWAIVDAGYGKVKVLNKAAGDGYTLKNDNDYAVMREGDISWDILANGAGFVLRETDTDNNYINDNNDKLRFWDSSNGRTDAGSTFTVEAVPEIPIVTITYNVTYNGSIVATATVPIQQGSTIPAIPTSLSRDYVTLTDKDSKVGTTANADQTVEVTATWDCPFNISSSFAEAKWHLVTIAEKYTYWNGTDRCPDTNTKSVADNAQWAFVGNPYDGFKIYNRSTGNDYLLQGDTQTEDPKVQVVKEGTTENNTWYIEKDGDSFYLKYADGKYLNDHGAMSIMTIWSSGSKMQVEKAVDVTYNIYFNEKKVATGTDQQYKDEAQKIPTLLDLGSLCTYNYRTDVTITADATYDVDIDSWNGPTLNESVENATWQNLAVRSTWYVTSDNKDGDAALKTVNANATGLVENAYQWAFVGEDPYHVQLFNRAEANNFGYSAAAQTNSGIPGFQADASYWTIKASTAIAGAFVLNVPGTNLYINQFGGAGGSLKFWDSTKNISDAGSAFTIFDVPTDFASFVADLAPYFEATGYFSLKDEVKTAAEWNTDLKTTCTLAQYQKLREAVDALSYPNSYILPETGYYRLKNNYYDKYMGLKATTVGGNYDADADVNGAPTIVKLTMGNNGTYSIALQGKYLQGTTQSAKVPVGDIQTYFNVSMASIGGPVGFATDAGFTYLHCDGSGNIVGWEFNAAASQWVIEDAGDIEITLNAGGDSYTYATLYVPFGVTLPNGVDAYVVSSTEDDSHATTKNIGKNIPAATPIILRGTATSITATINDDATANVDPNKLQGTYTEKSLGDGDVVLGKSNTEGIGFYSLNNGKTLGANKAYLNLSGSSVKGFVLDFDDDATGIEKTLSDSSLKSENIYNLAGQRIQKMQKGLYIVNGKKVLVK